MTVEEIRSLFRYDRWATEKLLMILEQIPADVYARDAGSSHGGIRGTLVHMVGAFDVWLRRWQGEHPTVPWREEDHPTFTDIRSKWVAACSTADRVLAGLTEDRLRAPWNYRDMKGNHYSQVLWKQMQHLINHASYHRGQIVTMLRQAGIQPVGTDLIYYYREQDANA